MILRQSPFCDSLHHPNAWPWPRGRRESKLKKIYCILINSDKLGQLIDARIKKLEHAANKSANKSDIEPSQQRGMSSPISIYVLYKATNAIARQTQDKTEREKDRYKTTDDKMNKIVDMTEKVNMIAQAGYLHHLGPNQNQVLLHSRQTHTTRARSHPRPRTHTQAPGDPRGRFLSSHLDPLYGPQNSFVPCVPHQGSRKMHPSWQGMHLASESASTQIP
jgi:hypothetical protein